MHKQVLLSFAVFVSLLHLLSTSSLGRPKGEDIVEIPVSFVERLWEIGLKFDHYFTIESGLIAANRARSLEGHEFPSKLKQTSLHGALEELRKSVPNLTYRINEQNPKIIHIIDVRLFNQKDYAMEKILDEFSFDGVVYEFVNALAKKGVNISAFGSLTTDEALWIDFKTKSQVSEKHQTVRNIATIFQPLEGRGGVIWIARTELGKNQVTYLKFWS